MSFTEPPIQTRLRPTERKVWLIFLHQLVSRFVQRSIFLSFLFYSLISPQELLYVLFSFSHIFLTSVFGTNSYCRASNLFEGSNLNIRVVSLSFSFSTLKCLCVVSLLLFWVTFTFRWILATMRQWSDCMSAPLLLLTSIRIFRHLREKIQYINLVTRMAIL